MNLLNLTKKSLKDQYLFFLNSLSRGVLAAFFLVNKGLLL